jgi:hypothetical protein
MKFVLFAGAALLALFTVDGEFNRLSVWSSTTTTLKTWFWIVYFAQVLSHDGCFIFIACLPDESSH